MWANANVMIARPNIGGALVFNAAKFGDAHY